MISLFKKPVNNTIKEKEDAIPNEVLAKMCCFQLDLPGIWLPQEKQEYYFPVCIFGWLVEKRTWDAENKLLANVKTPNSQAIYLGDEVHLSHPDLQTSASVSERTNVRIKSRNIDTSNFNSLSPLFSVKLNGIWIAEEMPVS